MGCAFVPKPDFIDEDSLTQAGSDGYEAYLRVFYYDFNAPYWKDPRLGGDGNLTIEDFVAMNFNEELGLYRGDVSDWQAALVRGYYTWKSQMDIKYPGNTYTSGKAALLNFMSRQTNIGIHRPGPANFDGPWTRLDDALTVVNTQIDPFTMGHPDWADGCVSNEPCQTGSHSPGSKDLPYIQTFIDNQCEPSFSVSGICDFYESFMFILDADDVNHWSGVVDK